MSLHESYMQRCLDIAVQGMGHVAPNPMVGCVIVHNGAIIGEGYHQKYGEAHAEVNAIASVSNKELLRESTLYVNLEPCSHYGKTPPCSDLIVRSQIPRVVIGSSDPNPLVAGKGIAKLRNAGVEVTCDILKESADFLNRRFLTFFTKKRPYIILKWAQSADGFIAPADNRQVWLSNELSQKLVHKWRSEEQAIMVGTNTARIDNPELTVRLWKGKNPLRVVIDKDLSLPIGNLLFNDKADTIVFNSRENSKQKNIEKIKIDFKASLPQQVLGKLYERGISSLIIEGGAVLLNSFIEANLWDEARIFKTTAMLHSGKTVMPLSGKLHEQTQLESDNLEILLNSSL